MLAAFWALSFALVMTPGADWAHAISAGVHGKAIPRAIGGMLLGYVAITLAVAAGIGALVASAPAALTALTIFGALYLTWLGVGVLLNPPTPQADGPADQVDWLLRGFVVSGMNPKALLLFIALLPEFTSRAAPWPLPGQIATMGLVQIVNCALVYSLVAFAGRLVLQSRPALARAVGRLSGAAMIAIALWLAAERFGVLG